MAITVNCEEPTFPTRPGLGAAGTPCVVKTNRFFVGLLDEGMHHYDVSISPEPATKGLYREVMSRLVSEHQQGELGGRLLAHDDGDGCGASLFAAGALPFDTKEFEVTASPGDGKYKVVIRHAAAISLLQLRLLLAGYPTDVPVQALQVLDMVLRDVAFSERNDMGCVAVDRPFSSQNLGAMKDSGLGIEGWKGLYPSISLVQNGLSVTIEHSQVLDRSLTEPEYAKLLKALKGVKVEVTHRGNARRRYRIAGLSVKPTNDLSFESTCGATKNVMDYFRERYNLELKYKFLPCLQVGSKQKLNYVPIEVCKILPRQCYHKKLEGSQVPTQMKSSIPQVVNYDQDNNTKHANDFGVEVDDNLTTVEARVLPPPNLKYHDSESQKTWVPSNGYWNMKEKKVVNGAKISNWACVNFCEDLSKNVVEQFCFKLAEMSRITGVDLADLKLPIFTARPDQVEDDIHMCYQKARNELRDQKIDLLLAILPDENGSLYGKVKKICETDIGLVSQCCRRSNIFTKNNKILANIAIKINAKAGGRNSIFDDLRKSLPIVSNKPTIIFGADVTHSASASLDDSAPSIASVVASQDWHEVVKYNGVVRAQDHHDDIISGLEEIVTELLHAFGKESNIKPQQLIFYRSGICEAQFKQVLEKEIPEIEKAWKALYNNEKPQITYIVLQKSHQRRLFPNINKYKGCLGDMGNVEPGTVIDREMCQPTEFDFFLCSHSGTQGISRPVQYIVLRDDNNFTADELQSLTNNLCYIYASCTQSVSIAPPAYYAHKLAQRARLYLAQGSDAAATAESSGDATAPKQLPEIKDELKRSMFYC